MSQYAAKKNLPMDNAYGQAADKYMKQVGVSRSQNGNTLQGTQQGQLQQQQNQNQQTR